MASLLLRYYWKTLLKNGFPDFNQKVFAELFSKSDLWHFI